MAPNFRLYFTMSDFSTTALLLFKLYKKQMDNYNYIYIYYNYNYHLCAILMTELHSKEDQAYQLGCMLS